MQLLDVSECSIFDCADAASTAQTRRVNGKSVRRNRSASRSISASSQLEKKFVKCPFHFFLKLKSYGFANVGRSVTFFGISQVRLLPRMITSAFAQNSCGREL